MIDWKEKAVKMSINGLNAREISNKLGLDYERTRNYIKKWRKQNGYERVNHGKLTDDSINSSVSLSNGIQVLTDERAIINGQDITPELILRAKGIDPAKWEVVSFVKNVWQGQNKNGQLVDMCQSKLIVKPKNNNVLTFEEIDDFFKNKEFKQSAKANYKINTDGEILEIDIADIHCGLLSWRNETGNDFDLKICKKQFIEGISEIVNRNKWTRFKKVYLCCLGDIIHIDNGESNTTTKGTIQQTDGRLTKIFDFAFEMMNEAIELLRDLNAEIHYIYTSGNHDRYTGYYLVKCLQIYNKDIIFDISPNPQKAISFGNVLVGLSHGDISKKNKGIWLLNDYRKEFGKSKFVEEHCGHLHSEGLQYINGVLVRNVLAQCGNSFWEHQQGYRSLRGIMGFVWSEQQGLKQTQYIYF